MTEGYRYNERNKLTERVRAGSLTIYRYDKNGSLVSEEEEGRKSEYRYDLLNRQTYVKTLDGREQEGDVPYISPGFSYQNKLETSMIYYYEVPRTEVRYDKVNKSLKINKKQQ